MEGRIAARWPGYAATAWMLVFGVAHGYWALGGTAVPPAVAEPVDTPMRIAAELAAVGLGAVGAVVALATVRPWGAQGRGVLVGSLWLAAAVAFVHSVSTVVDDLLAAAGLLDLDLRDRIDRVAHLVYEPFWMLGAVLCALAALAAMSRPNWRPGSPQEEPADDMLGCPRGQPVLRS